jgi:hypothetical protein
MNWSVFSFRIMPLAFGLLMTACAATQVSLDYQPTRGQIVKGAPIMAVGRFANARREDSYYLGVVRTPIGTPLEYIQSRTPVEEIVHNAFSHACSARGMLTSPRKARYVITGEVLELAAQQLVHPYGYARLRVNVVKGSTGQIVFSRVYIGERQNPAYRPGSGSPVPLLRELVSRALQDAVDRAMDDPEMRSRLGSGGSSYQLGML